MSYSSEVLADSPLVYWKLDETSGTSATDATGNGRTGTYFSGATPGGTSLVSTDSGRSVDFNGSGQSVFRSSESWMNVTAAITVEGWFRIDGDPGSSGTHALFVKDSFSATSTARAWRLSVIDATGVIEWSAYITGTTRFIVSSAAGALPRNTTKHIVGTYDGTTARLYIDGVEVANEAFAGSLRTSAFALQVGKESGGSSYSMNGQADEIAMYGSALSAARIDAHYDAGIGAPVTVNGGLIAETTTVHHGSVGAGTYGDGVYGDGVYGGAPATTVNGGLITETTTILAGTVLEGIVYVGGIITETTSVLPGVTSAGALVEGGIVSETTTVFAGSAADSGVVLAGLISETTTVLGGDVELGYTITARNRTSGRRRGGVASWEWEPNVAPVPAGMSLGDVFDTALAFNTPTLVNGRPLVTVTTATARRDRHRILVNNVDVTFFRSVPTPELDYQLTEPLLYGPATLDLPQVFAAFETPGAGDLSWLVPGAKVKQQRVNAAGVVTATDYKGRIIAFDTAGAEFRAEIGGEVSGPASMRERQVPLYRQVKDLGRQIYNALTPLGVRVKPFLGTVTGIETVVAGGTGWLDHLHRLHASGQKRNGDMLTTMPDEDGVYVTGWKDRTTIDFTVYPHDTQMPANLRRDIAAEANMVFVTSVAPNGMRILNGVYPGMIEGDNPDYPMNDDSPFGEGTADADTNTGDGVSVMIQQMRVHGFVTRDDSPGGYDDDVTEGIEALQERAGLTVTGNMNPATWRALFNLNRTGYSMSWSRIEPRAQKPYTRKWRRTADGSIIGRNPNYDPNRLEVHRNVDLGNGVNGSQQDRFARAEIDHGEDNWVGNLTVTTGAVIRGDHTPGDPITAADVMPAADIKPGMNGRLPLFMGGITVHVSGTRSAEGGTRDLHLDTRARDAVPVSQIILRNQETRDKPHRAFVRDHLSSGMVRDAVGEFSEVGGIIPRKVTLKAGEWCVFDVSSGRAGIIERLKITTNPNAEFSVAVFGEQISAKKLQAKIGDPLTAEGRENWDDETILNELDRDHLLLYAAGGPDARGGYWPHVADGSAILTGVWQDDAGFGYSVGPANVLRVAVCADRDTVIPAGRIMWPQLEPM